MTNTSGVGPFAGGERAHLVVPQRHLSIIRTTEPRRAATPTASAPSATVNRVAKTIQPLNRQTSVQAQSVQVQPKQLPSQPEFKPTIPVYRPVSTPAFQQPVAKDQPKAQPTVQVKPAAQQSKANVQPALDRQAILARAAQVRAQAKAQAEAKVKADLLSRQLAQQQQLAAQRQQMQQQLHQALKNAAAVSTLASTTPIQPARSQFSSPVTSNASANAMPAMAMAATTHAARPTMPVNNTPETHETPAASMPNLVGINPAGAAVMVQPSNALARLANAKITFNFKINKERIFTILRYAAVAVIIAASGYLAWDTYTTNQSVKETFNGGSSASAMSIAGTNPATADRTAISQQQRAAYTVPSDQARYIYIPAIGVNARVMSVGVNSKGNIDTPSNLNDTAWYDGSAKPGMDGQVFIDGHTSFSNSIPAAFNDLPKLKQGDQITIERGDGTKINYRVTDIQTKNASDVNMGEALNPPAGATKGLTLMTCTGTFNYRTQTADKRLIVYAVQE